MSDAIGTNEMSSSGLVRTINDTNYCRSFNILAKKVSDTYSQCVGNRLCIFLAVIGNSDLWGYFLSTPIPEAIPSDINGI